VTYALVMTILVLALIAVVVAVVVSTDEDLNAADAVLAGHQLEPESSHVPTQPTDAADRRRLRRGESRACRPNR
jgi:hypothetical protein